jgi:transmembrane sensor
MPLTQAEIEEADDLLVLLTFGSDGEKSHARVALDAWAARSPERLQYLADHHAAERTVDALASELQRLYPRQVGVPARPRSAPPHQPERPAQATRPAGVRVATYGLAFMCCAAIGLWVVNPTLATQNLHSSIGERVDVELDGGSHVVINTDTELTFVNRLRSRDVTMQRGEALFSVVHNALRPFTVTAGTASVHDIGTRFSVRKTTVGVNVAVLEGSVDLFPATGTAAVALHAGQAARTGRDGSIAMQDQQAFDAMTSWKDNRLQFNSMPLRDVVQEVQRYRKAPVVLTDARVGDYRVTGGFSSADPDLLLKTLSQVVPVTVEIQRNGTAVITARR